MKKVLFIILFCLISVVSFSQECDPQDPFNDPCDTDSAPIDSGVGLLIGAAALYTVKRIRDKKDVDPNAGLN